MSRLLFVIVLGLVLDLCSFAVSDSLLADSLWKKRVTVNYNLFDDNRAKRVGDIVTVDVSESTFIDNTEKSTTNNATSASASVDNNNFYNGVLHGLSSGRNAELIDRPANTFATDFTSDFSGKGTYDSTRAVSLKLTAMIVEVLDNGNLVLEGKRDVEVNKENYILKLTGIARPIDITTSNTISSSQMSNVTFALEGKGWLTRAGQKGWFHRVREILWPF
jgi:flagellar L-ring protein precursor FlgH